MTIADRLEPIIQELLDGKVPLLIARQEFEKQYVAAALAKCRKNVTRAAMLLGVHRNSVFNKKEPSARALLLRAQKARRRKERA